MADAQPLGLDLQKALEGVDLARAAGQRLRRGQAFVGVVQDLSLVHGRVTASQRTVFFGHAAPFSNGRTRPARSGTRTAL
jgi:hypothetical protein